MQAERTPNSQKVTLTGAPEEFTLLGEGLTALVSAQAASRVAEGTRLPATTGHDELPAVTQYNTKTPEEISVLVTRGFARRLYNAALHTALVLRGAVAVTGESEVLGGRQAQFAGLVRDLGTAVVGPGPTDVAPAEHASALELLES